MLRAYTYMTSDVNIIDDKSRYYILYVCVHLHTHTNKCTLGYGVLWGLFSISLLLQMPGDMFHYDMQWQLALPLSSGMRFKSSQGM